MKTTKTNFYVGGSYAIEKNYYGKKNYRSFLPKGLITLILFLTTYGLFAQSGGWDAFNTFNTTGYNDYGTGVIRLVDNVTTNCASSAVHETSDTYDPGSGAVFNKCYEAFFGCPGVDEIEPWITDQQGDGMAFSFWHNSATYNMASGLSCGGGLGYHQTTSDNKMITIEFDTWSSEGDNSFDSNYEGTGNGDQIAIHFDGIANDGGKLYGTSPGNLEDGLEHTVCINYDPASDVLTVSIDGSNVLVYDFTGTGYELENYFSGPLNQTWSSGKFGATNPATISDGADITDAVGGPLCPSGVFITSPGDNSQFSACSGPITIAATATPPSGNTVDYMEFFVDGVSIGTDYSEPYSITWTPPGVGDYVLTAEANYVPSGTTELSAPVDITVGDGLLVTSTVPTIDGNAEALWASYPDNPLNQVLIGGAGGADLQASFKVMWDANGLYFYVTVTDDVLNFDSSPGASFDDDKIEIYIDYGNDKPTGTCCYGGWTGNDHTWGWVVNDPGGNNVYFDPGNTPSAAGIQWAQGAFAGGYAFEIFIPWTTIGGGPPTSGDLIGIDMQVNDDDDGGGRDSKIGWSDNTDQAWVNPATWGTMQISGCDPLPVEMLSFTAQLIGGSAVLDWSTANELNNEKFIVQRSVDMLAWEQVGEVAGAGNTTNVTDYNFTDHTFPGGLVYYRLQQVDVDGEESYSGIVSVNSEDMGITISPNPFDDAFTIKGNTTGTVDVLIHDVLGRQIYQKTSTMDNGLLVIQPSFPTGTYLLTIQSTAGVQQQKITKK